MGVQFYLWVRFYETSGAPMRVSRPDGVEARLPIAALMNLKSLLVTHQVPAALRPLQRRGTPRGVAGPAFVVSIVLCAMWVELYVLIIRLDRSREPDERPQSTSGPWSSMP